jgi:hypothetical protein
MRQQPGIIPTATRFVHTLHGFPFTLKTHRSYTDVVSRTQMTNQVAVKRPLRDGLLLWGTASVVIVLAFGFYWLTDEVHISAQWRLYLLLNAAFSAIALWRFRTWFRYKDSGAMLVAWLVVHWLVYGLLARIHFNVFFCIFVFPAEAQMLAVIGKVQTAKRREKELRRAS